MATPEYFKGPPPSLGWWPTQSWDKGSQDAKGKAGIHLRWWDGFKWSVPVSEAEGYRVCSRTLNGWASLSTEVSFNLIEWSPRPDSWPPESRT